MQMILHPKSIFLYIFCLVCVSRIFSQMAIKKLKKLDFTTRLSRTASQLKLILLTYDHLNVMVFGCPQLC